MQVNISSRATAATHLAAASCRLAGAMCRLLGVVSPDEALDSLGQGEATLLLTCPSYLAELVTAARRRGLGPADFQLRRVTVGGEVLSPHLARAACQTLRRAADRGHLQHDRGDPGHRADLQPAPTCTTTLNTGLTELLDLRTGEPAAPGALATLVITPYFPYRDCMPVFRFDTRDVVRCLPEEASAASWPASPPPARSSARPTTCCTSGRAK